MAFRLGAMLHCLPCLCFHEAVGIYEKKAARKGGFFDRLNFPLFKWRVSQGMKLGVIINPEAARAASDDLAHRIQRILSGHQIPVSIRVTRNADLLANTGELLRESCDGIAVAGGDGSVSTVADICAREKVPIGVLPLGTHNHFARDALLPLELEESLACIAARRTRCVDLGSVNGRFFINNSSIGAYPRAVQERHRLESRVLMKRQIAAIIATVRVFARRPEIHANLHIEDEVIHRSSPFVFVGNNRYTVNPFAPQLRKSLNNGELCLFTASHTGLLPFVRMIWLACLGRLENADGFEMRICRRVVIHLPKPVLRVSKDGEVLQLSTPLEYECVPRALEIFAPST